MGLLDGVFMTRLKLTTHLAYAMELWMHLAAISLLAIVHIGIKLVDYNLCNNLP